MTTEPGMPSGARDGHGISFDELKIAYNFPFPKSLLDAFVGVLLSELAERAAGGAYIRVLDIGCGEGIGRNSELSRKVCSLAHEAWGVEPDRGAAVPAGVFANVIRAPLEEAQLPASHFDIAYCYMVVEHLRTPADFLARALRTLKPGGVLIAVTPNGDHLFGRLAKLAARLRLEDVTLWALRGRSRVQAYHYPVQYRLNTATQWQTALMHQPGQSLEIGSRVSLSCDRPSVSE